MVFVHVFLLGRKGDSFVAMGAFDFAFASSVGSAAILEMKAKQAWGVKTSVVADGALVESIGAITGAGRGAGMGIITLLFQGQLGRGVGGEPAVNGTIVGSVIMILVEFNGIIFVHGGRGGLRL